MNNTTPSQRIEVTIPVKPHLAKYVRRHLRSQNGVLLVDANSALGTFFYNMVQKGLPKQKPTGHTITISMPPRDVLGKRFDGRSEGLHINEHNAVRINEFLDFIFRKELFAKLDLIKDRNEANRKSGKMKDVINNFLTRFEIEESELSYDTIAKSYFRYRQRGRILIEKLL